MSRRIVVAHESEAIREAAMRVVRDAGFEAVGVADGESARVLCLSVPHPAALVVDVGLPRVLGYELCEQIRGLELPVRIILVASVYSKTAYKRRPTSLYGADDYVEQHHIPDQLAPKLAKLVPAGHPPPARDVHDPFKLTVEEKAEVERIRSDGEARLALPPGSPEESLERARRLARLIVADVVLYNGALVAEGLRDGNLLVRLEKDLTAARALFAQAVPAEVVAGQDLIGEAVSAFMASRPAGVGH